MTYQIEFTKAAALQVRKLPKPARDRVLATIESLQTNPGPPGSRKLAGEDIAWRIRIGDYRVIYEIFDNELVVTVVRARHRRDVYTR